MICNLPASVCDEFGQVKPRCNAAGLILSTFKKEVRRLQAICNFLLFEGRLKLVL